MFDLICYYKFVEVLLKGQTKITIYVVKQQIIQV